MAFNILYENASTEESAFKFLQQNNLVRLVPPICAQCPRQMTVVKTGRGDKRCFRCPTHKGAKMYLNKGTFFEQCQLTSCNIVELLFSWSCKVSIAHTTSLTGLSEKTVVQWFSRFREVCSHKLTENPVQIGGVGQHVEINEILLPKLKSNGARVVPLLQTWVFGGVDRATGRGFLELVPDRSTATLDDCIKKHIAPGSIISSKGLASYNNIVNIPVVPKYQHIVIVHDQDLVDPITGTCTKTGNYWKVAKRRLNAMGGTNANDSMTQSHLDESLWRGEYGKTPEDAFNNIVDHIQEWFPAP